MQKGECKLCQNAADLHDSHFMPSAMYKVLRDKKRKNPNPIVITNTKTGTTSKQVTDYVFCGECEQRFSKREAHVMSLIGPAGRFPIRDKMELLEPMRRYCQYRLKIPHSAG
jgi:hypothetical protein